MGKIKSKIKNLIIRVGKILLGDSLIPMDIKSDINFMKIYSKCEPYTMVSVRRSFALYNAVKYIIENNIEGDFVECGVWKGGQSMLIAETLLLKNESGRKIFLYDTFGGMSEPTDKDVWLRDGSEAISRWEKEEKEDHNKWCFASLSEVKLNMVSTGYPEENIKFIKGKVEETIPETVPDKIALLRLDTDWYESTLHELNYLFPLLVRDGVLAIDDYGSWRGSKEAVDEYLKDNNVGMLLHRVDSGRFGVKT